MAYGFRDMGFFKLKIMALHETKYALVGGTFFCPDERTKLDGADSREDMLFIKNSFHCNNPFMFRSL